MMDNAACPSPIRAAAVLKPHPANQQQAYPEISIREFLDFLKTAYQVQDSLENVLLANGMTAAVDWLKVKENHRQLVRLKEAEQMNQQEAKRDVTRKKSDCTITEHDPLKRKLSEILSEGLLDSILPYLAPQMNSQPTSRRNSLLKIQAEKSSSSQSCSVTALGSNKAIKTPPPSKTSVVEKQDSEVEIHVCDEVKNQKRDFTCNQRLLVEKMAYFGEVTAGQRLEDMDISVHCDITIFDWLMRWVKKDSLLEEDWPRLDAQCVVPVLVSAAFLQMEPLQHDCLLYCHAHMNEVLRTTTNMACLNDSILTRLAAMYTNAEVEAIKDRKDKIQSRLFTKLIQSLAEAEAESVRGHWCSLFRLFRCAKCQQLVSYAVGGRVPCVPNCQQLQCDGSIVSRHQRDPHWSLSEHVSKLYRTLKSWRKVYWRLWGQAHFLYCTLCKRFFPSHQIGWCRYHPDAPQYFTLEAQKAPLPVGRYPCCGERAYRFQLLQDYSGCQFREHTVLNTTTAKDVHKSAGILAMLDQFRHLIEEEPPQLLFPERLTRLVARDPTPTTTSNGGGGGSSSANPNSDTPSNKRLLCKETFWWEGFQIVPPRPKLGLLSQFTTSRSSGGDGGGGAKEGYWNGRGGNGANKGQLHKNKEPSSDDASSVTASSTNDSSDDEDNDDEDSSTSESSEGSAECATRVTNKKIVVRRRNSKTKKQGKLWQHNLSARSNQDIQRAYEETVTREMTATLNRKLANSHVTEQKNRRHLRQVTPIGGLWVRLEAEWREQNCAPPPNQNSNKNRSIFTSKPRTSRK